jgi:hypothetical protein
MLELLFQSHDFIKPRPGKGTGFVGLEQDQQTGPKKTNEEVETQDRSNELGIDLPGA